MLGSWRRDARAMERRAHGRNKAEDQERKRRKKINKSATGKSSSVKNSLSFRAFLSFSLLPSGSSGRKNAAMKNTAPPLSSGSPRGIHSLPRISVPHPCLFNEGSGAPLLMSPRRLTGAFSPRGSRPASLDMPRPTTTVTNECSASGSATSSSFVDRRSRTSSESEVSAGSLCFA